jgi:5-methylcytosine-specific restriction protein B
VDVRGAAFDRGVVAAVDSAAEDERKQVLSLFPLEAWAHLPLERYALGQAVPPGSGPTYC